MQLVGVKMTWQVSIKNVASDDNFYAWGLADFINFIFFLVNIACEEVSLHEGINHGLKNNLNSFCNCNSCRLDEWGHSLHDWEWRNR
jgi:hypothetical protein